MVNDDQEWDGFHIVFSFSGEDMVNPGGFVESIDISLRDARPQLNIDPDPHDPDHFYLTFKESKTGGRGQLWIGTARDVEKFVELFDPVLEPDDA